MVIDCKHVWNYISEYLDGTLPDETRAWFRSNLRQLAASSWAAGLESTCSPAVWCSGVSVLSRGVERLDN